MFAAGTNSACVLPSGERSVIDSNLTPDATDG